MSRANRERETGGRDSPTDPPALDDGTSAEARAATSDAVILWQASDDRLAGENLDLRRENARLRAENARLQAQTAVDMSELHAAMVGALLNPHLKCEAPVMVRAIVEIDRRYRQAPTADGWVVVPLEAIGAPVWSAPGELTVPSLRHRTTVSRHLQRGAEWGVIERKVDVEAEEEPVVDRATGQPAIDPKTGAPVTRRRLRRVTRLRRTGDLVTMLGRLAGFRRPEPSRHGGARSGRSLVARDEGEVSRAEVASCDNRALGGGGGGAESGTPPPPPPPPLPVNDGGGSGEVMLGLLMQDASRHPDIPASVKSERASATLDANPRTGRFIDAWKFAREQGLSEREARDFAHKVLARDAAARIAGESLDHALVAVDGERQ